MADIGESSLTLDFVIEGQDENAVEMEALAVVSLAIRECGARHVGLYPIAEERRLRSRVNAFSGLRMPNRTLVLDSMLSAKASPKRSPFMASLLQ